MAKTAKISQKKWIRGVNAAASDFAQPPGSFPRDSNAVFLPRGSLFTCDGSKLISANNGVVGNTVLGFIAEIFLYEPIGGANSYFALIKDAGPIGHLGPPAGLAAAVGAAGALTGVYKWVVTALDGNGGETTVSNEATQTLTAQKGNLTWTAVPRAQGYNIYRTVAGGGAGTEHFAGTSATNSFTDNVPDGSLTTKTPPSSDNTQSTQFFQIPPTSYAEPANVIFTFPPFAGDIPAKDGTGGGFGGGGGTGLIPPTSGNQPPTPGGGIVGILSPIPQILQFKNLMILLLGNGIVPYSSDGTTPNTIPLVNTFQASYGVRSASTVQNVGDQIAVNVGGTNYIFTVTQAGTTGAGGPPAFSAVLGSIVVDGTVYWKNTGAIAAVTAPRGAAHGIVYAGSLWVGNTSPTTTTDNFDGPSCLKMSDLNNPNSWNPLNVAFLDRDDGTQITGMATFTIAESGIPPSGSLVVFKDFSTFQINGVFGASNFSIQRAQTDLGCVAPRTIQFVPGFGIVRMTHLGIAMFDGVRDRLISEEVRPYIFGGDSDIFPADWNFIWFAKAAMTSVPPMYCCAIPLRNLINATNPALTFSVASNLAVGTPWPNGTWFVTVQGISPDGHTITQIGTEQSVTLVGSNDLLVTLPPNAGFSQWRIYLGNSGPGSENEYAIIPGNVLSVEFGKPFVTPIPLYPGGTQTNLGQMTRLLCYDLVLKAWTVIDLPFPISALKQFRTIGSIPITVMGGFNDGGIRRWLGGAGLDTTWDAGAVNAGAPDNQVRASVRTPQVFGKDASDRVYLRQLAIRGKGTPVSLATLTTVNGVAGAKLVTRNLTALPMGGTEFVAYAELGITGVDAHADVSWTGPLEIDSIDWLAIAKAIRGRVAV
jgi:hypothetical protein